MNQNAAVHQAATQQAAALQAAAPEAGPATEYHVHYLDVESGRLGHETFDDLADAERFAGSKLSAPESWATVDAVPAAREGRLVA